MTRARCATAQTKSRSSVTRQSRSETLNMGNLRHAASIMIPALHDLEPLLPTLTGDAIHQPVLAENAAGAPALQGMLQRLGPAMKMRAPGGPIYRWPRRCAAAVSLRTRRNAGQRTRTAAASAANGAARASSEISEAPPS